MTDIIEGMARAIENAKRTGYFTTGTDGMTMSKHLAQAAMDYLKQPQPAVTVYNPQDFAQLVTAYLALLGLPHGYTRLCLQPVLAGLRDRLAVMSGVPAEAVQEQYETLAAQTSASKPSSWQPIETAPMDGTIILVTGDRLYGMQRWDTTLGCKPSWSFWMGDSIAWHTDYDGICSPDIVPTHWLHLPAPPASKPPSPEGQGPELSQEQIEAMERMRPVWGPFIDSLTGKAP